ncbi:MAG TPA: phage-shock protein [Candidatus Bathyarchaeia archaeon]|nr:phage-shock protein [Candidatus Bathyarchaeia archaeon]
MPDYTLMLIIGLVLTYSLAKTAIKVNASGAGKRHEAEETQLVQDIHRQLEHIEQRVEALETILLDRESARTKTSSQLD